MTNPFISEFETSSETIFVARGETKTILHLNIVILIRKCAHKSL